jgi:copper(I)-binding protein
MRPSARSGRSCTSAVALATALLWSGAAVAQIHVDDAWAPITIGRASTGVVYLTLHNRGDSADRLIAAASAVAAKAELHAHVMEGGLARMARIEAVDVAPGSPTVLQPGGLHLMLFDVKAPLRAGARFAIELTFARAGKVIADVAVRDPRAPPASQHRH